MFVENCTPLGTTRGTMCGWQCRLLAAVWRYTPNRNHSALSTLLGRVRLRKFSPSKRQCYHLLARVCTTPMNGLMQCEWLELCPECGFGVSRQRDSTLRLANQPTKCARQYVQSLHAEHNKQIRIGCRSQSLVTLGAKSISALSCVGISLIRARLAHLVSVAPSGPPQNGTDGLRLRL